MGLLGLMGFLTVLKLIKLLGLLGKNKTYCFLMMHSPIHILCTIAALIKKSDFLCF